jgi:phosphoglucomutase/phosphomannomutase
MDRAVAVALNHPSAELILATDPDADRLGAMAPARTGGPGDGNWRYLTGNEIAALLTHFKLSQLTFQNRMPPSPIVIKTEVTTGLVSRIARKFGCQVVENLLVGFKFVADVLAHLDDTGRYEDVTGRPEDMLMACEESHGILVTPHIRDKDAAGAGLLLAELALYQKRRGFTVVDYLHGLWREFGYFRNVLQTITMTGILGKQQMLRLLNSLRADPPRSIAGLRVTAFEDLQREDGRLGPLKGATDAAGRNFLIFRLGEQARVALRPSGTEPKAKAYLEVCSPPQTPRMSADEWQAQCQTVDELMQRLQEEFLRLAMERGA